MIDIELLKSKSALTQFKKGQIIIEDGDTKCNEMYILLKGSADIYKNYGESEELKITVLKPGDFFGEMSLFLNKERTATVVASEDVIALTINQSNAYEFFEKQPQATYSLIKTLCSRLEHTNKAYNKLYNETHPEGSDEIPPQLQWLFPDEHKIYRKIVNMSKVSPLTEKKYECPLCGSTFAASTAKRTGEESAFTCQRPDKGKNDYFFDVITCTGCRYSAFADIFNAVDKNKAIPEVLKTQIDRSKQELNNFLDDKKGITGIFAKYYLALKCAPEFFSKHEEIKAQLWVRLSWLYGDCKDENLELYAVSNAQKAYIAAFNKGEIPRNQVISVQFAIGELSFKMNDLKTAEQYFNRVSENGNAELKFRADERLDDVRQGLRELVTKMRDNAK